MARPEIATAEKRNLYMAIRLTQEEKDIIYKAAKSIGQSPAVFARYCILQHAESWLKQIDQAAKS